MDINTIENNRLHSVNDEQHFCINKIENLLDVIAFLHYNSEEKDLEKTSCQIATLTEYAQQEVAEYRKLEDIKGQIKKEIENNEQ